MTLSNACIILHTMHIQYTHICKYCLLFINKKEAKLMFKFRNICHLENTPQYGKGETIIYTFPLTYICIFLMTIKCKIRSTRWLSLLVTIIKICCELVFPQRQGTCLPQATTKLSNVIIIHFLRYYSYQYYIRIQLKTKHTTPICWKHN